MNERALGARNTRKKDSHMYRHFLNEHKGAEEPKFMVETSLLSLDNWGKPGGSGEDMDKAVS